MQTNTFQTMQLIAVIRERISIPFYNDFFSVLFIRSLLSSLITRQKQTLNFP